MNNWYAVYTKPHKEFLSYRELQRQNFKVYVPKIKTLIKHARKVSHKIKPFFPRYIFVALDITHGSWASVNSTRGVVKLISSGGKPIKVSEKIIEELMSKQNDEGLIESIPTPKCKIGAELKIVDGPFYGLHGLFAGLSDDMRVKVLLDIMGRSLTVPMSNNWVSSV